MEKKMETMMIDLHVHTIHSKEKCANLSVKETLNYFQQLGERQGKRVFIRINDHNTIFGGVEAMEEYLNNRDLYPNIFVIPGCEFNVNLSPILKISNKNYVFDEKNPNFYEKYAYIFKKAHIGASPCMKDLELYKKWKDNKDLIVYSKLSKMHIDSNDYTAKYYFKDQVVNTDKKDSKPLCNLGEQLIACKNIFRKKYGVIIPFAQFECCVQEGLTKKAIIDNFFAVATKYFKQNYAPFAELSTEEIYDKLFGATLGYVSASRSHNLLGDYKAFAEKISGKLKVELPESIYKDNIDNPQNQNYDSIVKAIVDDTISYLASAGLDSGEVKGIVKQFAMPLWKHPNGYIDVVGLREIYFDELAEIIYDCGGYMDIEHPNSAFKLYDNTIIPTSWLKDLDLSLMKQTVKNQITDLINSNETIMVKDIFGDNENNYDSNGILKLQLLKKAIDNSDIKLTNGLMGAEIPKYYLYDVMNLDKVLDIYNKNNILCSYGDDKHMSIVDKYIMISKNEPEVTTKNGKQYVIDKTFAQNVYNYNKERLELKHEFDRYEIPTDRKQHINVHNYDQYGNLIDYTKTDTYANMVTQLGYCDTLLGRENLANNNITIRGGRLINENEINQQNDIYSTAIAKILIQTNDYAKQKLNLDDENVKAFISTICEQNKKKILMLKEQKMFNTEQKIKHIITLVLNDNKNQIDQFALSLQNHN